MCLRGRPFEYVRRSRFLRSHWAPFQPRLAVLWVVLRDQQFTVRPVAWKALVVSSRAAIYVDAFEADTARRSPFFSRKGPSCPGPVGAATVRSRGPTEVIPCVYTAAVFKADVAPPLGALDATLDRVALPRDDRSKLTDAIVKASRAYGTSYGAALSTYYKSYHLASPTAAALGADLADLVSPPSFLTDFLEVVAENANLGPQQGPYLAPIGDSLADFAPIVRLMDGTPGKYPNLEKYYALLAPMLASLGPALPGPLPAPGAPLEERLSPVGKLGLVMVTGGEGSPYVAVQSWLDQQAMPPSLRAPFILPVNLAYQFGLGNLAQTVQAAYASEIVPTVRPLLTRFPFERTSDIDAAAADVQAVFGPKGSFSQSFQQLIAPVCVDGGEIRWTPKSTPFGPVPVPAEALRLARRASALAATLWGDDGKLKPIALMVRPLPLPAMGQNRSITLSSLRAGKTSVFGFNQTPSWQPLPIEWGVADTASATLRSTATGGGDDRYHAIDTGPSEWSFHRLLRKGRVAGSVVSWSFPGDTTDAPPSAVSFGFQADPWAPFPLRPTATDLLANWTPPRARQRMSPMPSRRGCCATLLLLAPVLLAACGGSPQMKLRVSPANDTNDRLPCYLVVRRVDPKAYVSESYQSVASMVMTPDDSVVTSALVFPGTAQDFTFAPPTLLAAQKIDTLGVTPEIRDLLRLRANQGLIRSVTHWFKSVDEPMEWLFWRDFAMNNCADAVVSSNVLVDAAAGGCVLFSTRRPKQSIHARALPSAGRRWTLADPTGAPTESEPGNGVFLPEAAKDGWFLLARTGREYLWGSTLAPRRAGRVFPASELCALIAGLPSVVGACVVPLPASAPSPRFLFILLVFTGAAPTDGVADRVKSAIAVSFGPDFVPDDTEVIRLFPRRKGNIVDAEWCRGQYLTGRLGRKAVDPSFEKLTMLRGMLLPAGGEKA